MESQNMSDSSLSISEMKGGAGNSEYPTMDDGTYEAQYEGLRVLMDTTQWGPKKIARLYFTVTRGKYRGGKASYRGSFIQDRETQAWVVGSKSKLADAMRAITGGQKTLDETHKGRKVFIIVKKTVSKKTGKDVSFVESVVPGPDDTEPMEQAAAPLAAAPAQAVIRTQAPATVKTAAPAKPVIPPAAQPASENLIDELTEFSDFKE